MNPVMFSQDRERSPMMRAALALLSKQKPIRHWSDGISNAANSIAGALMQGKAVEADKLSKMETQDTLAQAMKAAQGWKNPDTGQMGTGKGSQPGGMEAMASVLAGNPNTADMGMNITLAKMQGDQAFDRQRQLITDERGYNEKQTEEKRLWEAKQLEKRLTNNLEVAKAKGDMDMQRTLETMLVEHRMKFGDMGSVAGGNPQTVPVSAPEEQKPTVGALGAPLPDTNPLEGLPPQEAAKLAASLRKEAIGKFQGDEEAVQNAQNMVRDLDRFITLMDEGLDTGGQYNIPGAEYVASGLSPEVAEAKSIVDKMTPIMRQGLPGAASERDTAMFRSATVGLTKPEQANRNIAAGLKLAQQNLLDKREFQQAYFDQNKHLQGADRAWNKYLESNPIFKEGKDYKLNEDRQDWRSFFANMGNPSAPDKATPSAKRMKYNPATGKLEEVGAESEFNSNSRF